MTRLWHICVLVKWELSFPNALPSVLPVAYVWALKCVPLTGFRWLRHMMSHTNFRVAIWYYWRDIPQRITFKLCLLVFKCLHGLAPRYLAELFVPVADVMERRNLRSATRGLLNFPRYNMTSYGRRAFSYAGRHAWNSLPEHLRQTTSIQLFKRSLKTFLFGQIARWAH